MTNEEKRNIYNNIQNLYNMDFKSWQEVLAMMYNLVSDIEQKFENFEQRFELMVGKEVTEVINKMYLDGTLASIINEEIFSDLNVKIDKVKSDITFALSNEIKSINEQLDKIERIEINIERLGGIGDGTFDNSTIVDTFKTNIGSNGTLYFPEGTWFIGGTRPDLSGLYIKTHPKAILKLDESPNNKTVFFLTDATINNTTDNTIYRKPQNYNLDLDYSSLLRNVVNQNVEDEEYKNLSWNEFIGKAINGATISDDNSYTINNDDLAFGTVFTNGIKGMFKTILDNEYIETTFKKPNNYGATKYIGICFYNNDYVYTFAQYPTSTTVKIIRSKRVDGSTDVILDSTTPNGGAYGLSDNSAITMGVNKLANEVELYINGCKIYDVGISNVEYIGFVVANTENTNYILTNPCSIKNLDSPNYKNIRIACFGDSQTYGAWSNIEYPRFLCEMLRYSKNIGDINFDNYAVSGHSSSQQLDMMKTVDLTNYKYTTIMIGTNDVQGNIDVTTFINNINEMVNYCKGKGTIPIVGIFPIFTTKSITGYGKDTTNYHNSALYVSELKKYCIKNNVKIANVRFNFGNNINWFSDNIHPNERGMIAIARAFYNAIKSIE